MPEKMTTPAGGGSMTLFDHIDALKFHLLRSAVAVFAAALLAFVFKEFVIDGILFAPRSPDFITNRLIERVAALFGAASQGDNIREFTMINTRMAGQFSLHMSISIMAGIVISAPYVLWELWQFVKPALSSYERRRSNLFIAVTCMFFFMGVLFGYYVISPVTVSFLAGYNASPQITDMIDVGSYLSTISSVSLACGVVFELPVLIYFLSRTGIVTPAFLKKYRRHAIIVLLVFAAVITPPDVFSQMLVAVPMMALYELGIVISKRVEARRIREEMASCREIYGGNEN